MQRVQLGNMVTLHLLGFAYAFIEAINGGLQQSLLIRSLETRADQSAREYDVIFTLKTTNGRSYHAYFGQEGTTIRFSLTHLHPTRTAFPAISGECHFSEERPIKTVTAFIQEQPLAEYVRRAIEEINS